MYMCVLCEYMCVCVHVWKVEWCSWRKERVHACVHVRVCMCVDVWMCGWVWVRVRRGERVVCE